MSFALNYLFFCGVLYCLIMVIQHPLETIYGLFVFVAIPSVIISIIFKILGIELVQSIVIGLLTIGNYVMPTLAILCLIALVISSITNK